MRAALPWWFWAAIVGLLIGFSLYGATPDANAAAVDRRPNVCFALREGASLASIEADLERQGYTATDAGAAAGADVRDHCPDQTDNVLNQLHEAGLI